LLTPKFSEAENSHTSLLSDKICYSSVLSSGVKSSHTTQFKTPSSLLKTINTDFFEQRIRPRESEESTESLNRAHENLRD